MGKPPLPLIPPSPTHPLSLLLPSQSNFQGFYQCPNSTLVARPSSIQELKEVVAEFEHVKAVGVGHSWNREQFCAQTSPDSSVGLVTTEILPVLSFIENPMDSSEFLPEGPPESFPIQVDEENATVTVAAGVPQRMLLDYLSNYTQYGEPRGWVLPAFSWFIDQTIGGAVATATHGSSMTWGSLSSQLTQLKLVIANGTELTLTPESHPHLWKAAAVSIGRLGVITEVTLRIVPQKAVVKEVDTIDIGNFTAAMLEVEAAYNAAVAANDEEAVREALFAIDETQLFWFLPADSLWRVDYSYEDKEPENVIPNIDPTVNLVAPAVRAEDGPDGAVVFDQAPLEPLGPNLAMATGTDNWNRFYTIALRGYVIPGTYSARQAYLSQTEFTTASATFAPYDQYEVAIPISRAGSCLREVSETIYGPDALWEGFRTPALIRFISAEEFYLAPTNGEPHMYVNLEDYISKSSGQNNSEFQTVISLFREKCGARLHWGKAGWPEHAACFDGAKEYPQSWCDYGCAVRELDPTGKFDPISSVWQWNATRGGKAVEDFGACCTPEGFSDACTCAHRTDCAGIA